MDQVLIRQTTWCVEKHAFFTSLSFDFSLAELPFVSFEASLELFSLEVVDLEDLPGSVSAESDLADFDSSFAL